VSRAPVSAAVSGDIFKINIAPTCIFNHVAYVLRMNRQLSLFSRSDLASASRVEHGGSVRRGRRKLARPFSTRRPLHVVLRSTRARGAWSLRRVEARLREAMKALARRTSVRVYDYANAGNHLHLLVRAKQRSGFQAFLRSFAGIAARLVTGARRGQAVGRFWDELAYSRVVSWGREFTRVREYVAQNELEALGVISYQPRSRRRLSSSNGRSPPE
jgi:REP element-mobilizing transposase RayT